MKDYAAMIEQYLEAIDELEDGDPVETEQRSAVVTAELDSSVAEVLKAARGLRIRRQCRRRRRPRPACAVGSRRTCA